MATQALWTLPLDEEGYPVMDNGLRGDDLEFLKLVFQNLKRYEGNDKNPLCTQMSGKEVIVTSFDDPLVAQEVLFDEKNNQLQWNFLGDLSHKINLSDLRVDEWNRLHAYVGAEKIPAVMSRKTQAAFLLNFKDLHTLQPKAYRAVNVENESWGEHYKKNDTPWDMGKANPVFLAHSQRMIAESGPLWLFPGAGTGHEIPLLEEAGKQVTALDLSSLAKESFFKLYPKSSCNYVAADFFAEKLGPFDAVLENYFFVAISPRLRSAVLQRIAGLLKPKGLYGGSFFTRFAEGGPPFGLSEWELKSYVERDFEILEWQRSPHSHPKRAHMELWVLLRKKL